MRRMICIGTVALALSLLAGAATAGNPIPGVGIVVKRNPGTGAKFAPGPLGIAPDFFGPGSEAFAGTVELQGHCSLLCGGCDADCGGNTDEDSRIDYSEGLSSSTFDAAMAPLSLYSVAPIAVNIGGTTSYFDVVATVRRRELSQAAIGEVQIPVLDNLAVGASSVVESSHFDVDCDFAFYVAGTATPAGVVSWPSLRIDLRTTGLPVTRVVDGTASGLIVLGLDTGGTVPFTYASANDELVLSLKSLYQLAVGSETASWGTLKGSFR